ncbi:MAG: tetratricopeptide repeat protein [bacterium]
MRSIRRPNLGRGLAIVLLIGEMTLPLLCAGARKTPEMVLASAGGIEALLLNPVSNVANICVCLKGPGPSADAIRARILERRVGSGGPADAAALSYISGEARYWTAFDKFRSMKSGASVDSDARNIVGSYLDAWDMVCKVDGARKNSLRGAVIARLKTLFSTEVYGAALPIELKQRAVKTFVDVIEKETDGRQSLCSREMARVYVNLGISDRVSSQLPKQIPDDADSLKNAMMLAVGLKKLDQAGLYASALADRHAEYLRANVGVWYEVFRVYRDSGSPRTLDCIRAIAQKDPAGYLCLYDVSRKLEVDTEEDKRVKYLDSYVELSLASEKSLPRVVSAAAQRILRAKQYQSAIDFIDRHCQGWETTGGAVLWQIKGRCYEEMKRPEDAVEAYRRCVDLANGTRYADRLTRECSQRLTALGAVEKKEVGKEGVDPYGF